MLSKSAEYALRALQALAFEPGDGPVPSARLADRAGVPENYLSKVLHRLEQEGVVTSRRGPGGGFTLGRDPAAVALADVIRPFDDTVLDRRCLLGRPECRDDSPCAAHERWLEVAGRVRRFFEETSLEELGPPAAGAAGAAAAVPLADDDGERFGGAGPTDPREAT
jgi:Rrf2 family iron-sulfur cluster assembly transcriptional regulator